MYQDHTQCDMEDLKGEEYLLWEGHLATDHKYFSLKYSRYYSDISTLLYEMQVL